MGREKEENFFKIASNRILLFCILHEEADGSFERRDSETNIRHSILIFRTKCEIKFFWFNSDNYLVFCLQLLLLLVLLR